MASYVVQIPIAGFDCVVYSGYRYATLDMLGMFQGNKYGYEELTPLTALKQWRMLPPGWELVPSTEEVKKDVIGAHDWGCTYVALADGTYVETGMQEGERKEWKWGLEKHRKKAAYRVDSSWMKARILMRKSMDAPQAAAIGSRTSDSDEKSYYSDKPSDEDIPKGRPQQQQVTPCPTRPRSRSPLLTRVHSMDTYPTIPVNRRVEVAGVALGQCQAIRRQDETSYPTIPSNRKVEAAGVPLGQQQSKRQCWLLGSAQDALRMK